MAGSTSGVFVASIAAPIVEETMFRVCCIGTYASRRGVGRFPKFRRQRVVVSFVFAVIHPQGLIAVPLLMALAGGFTIMREWRGSLISCMVAHGLSNAVVLTITTTLLNA